MTVMSVVCLSMRRASSMVVVRAPSGAGHVGPLLRLVVRCFSGLLDVFPVGRAAGQTERPRIPDVGFRGLVGDRCLKGQTGGLPVRNGGTSMYVRAIELL